MNSSVVFSTFTVLCTDCLYLVLKPFHHSRRKPLPMKQLLPIPLLFQALATTRLCYVSMDLPILDISYTWNQAVYDLLCLASFTYHILKVHPHGSTYQHFIPFYEWIIFYYIYYICIKICLCVHLLMDFLKKTWIDIWAISTFWLLWVVLLWICVHMYCLFSVLLGMYLRVELLGHMVIPHLTF